MWAFEREVRQVDNAMEGEIGPAPVPDFTRPVDFVKWAMGYSKWHSKDGQPQPRVRMLVCLVEIDTEARS